MTLSFLEQDPALAYAVLAVSVLCSPLIAGIERIILGCIFVALDGLMFNTVLLAPVLLIIGSISVIVPQVSVVTGIQIILIAFLTPAIHRIGFYLMGLGFIFLGQITEWKFLLHLMNMTAFIWMISFLAPPSNASVFFAVIVVAVLIGDSMLFRKTLWSEAPGGMIG